MLARNLHESPRNWAEIDRSAECVVYCIRHIGSGCEYVGSTSRPLRLRIKEHRKDVRSGSQHSLHEAIRTFGWDAFELEILSFETLKTLRKAEIDAINSRPCAFNQAKGGNTPSSGWQHSEMAKKLMSAPKQGSNNPAARAVKVDGNVYATVKDCCAALGISFPTLRSRLTSAEHPNYQYAE